MDVCSHVIGVSVLLNPELWSRAKLHKETISTHMSSRTHHICILGSYGPSLIRFRGDLIKDLVAAGYRVSVAAPNITAGLAEKLASIGAQVFETSLERTGTNIFNDLAYYCRLVTLLKEIKPDLLLTYTIKPNIWGAFAAHRTGARSIAMVTGLGYTFIKDGDRKTLKKQAVQRVARFLYRAATGRNWRVIFQNPDDLRDFVAAGCLADRDKTQLVAGSGVDMKHYQRRPLPESPVVLMIARLLRTKGVADYAKAADILRQRHQNARFQLIGSFDFGPDSIAEADLQEWIANGLEYLGPKDDVRDALAQSRIYVLPSYREGTPRSVLEAMAMGRPVITTDVPGCRETVQDGVNGILVPVRDALALANAISHLIDDPSLAARMGDASFDLAARKFDVRKVNAQMMEAMGL
jgi:glycosyltransferase involved in cell wall biosynthesis